MTIRLLHARATEERELDVSGCEHDIHVTTVETASQALEALTTQSFDCLVAAHSLDGGSGLTLLESVDADGMSVPFVLYTAEPDGELASEATRHDLDAYHVRKEASLEQRVIEVLDANGALEEQTASRGASDGGATTHGDPFLQITDALNDAVVTLDTESTIRFANDELAALTGYEPAELEGKSFTQMMPERFRDAHRQGVQQYLETGERTLEWDYIELAVRHRDGHEIPVAVSFGEFERDGKQYFTGVIRDISDRKSQANALQNLHETASDPSLTTHEKVRQVLEDHRERLGVSIAYLSRIEDGTETLVVATGDHEFAEDGLSVPVEQTYCQYTLEQDDPLVVTDAETNERIEQRVYDFSELACYLGQTVTVDGEPYGTICFADETATSDTFDDADLAFLEVLADWIGYELTEQRRREQLREERERVENILERIDSAFFAVDDEWRFTYFNRRAEEVLGRSREEVLGENIWDVYEEAVDTTFDEKYHEAMETQEGVVFEEYYPPLEKWFRVSAYPSQSGLSVYFDDITEQKEYTRKLSALHSQTRSLVQAESPAEVGEAIVDASVDVLGYDLCVVRRRDGDRLVPIASSRPATEFVSEIPVHDLDAWGAGDAIQRNETVLVSEPQKRATRAASGLTPDEVAGLEAVLYVPIPNVGVLGIGSRSGTFDETDRSLAEVLAANAAVAFERVAREADLRVSETVLEALQGNVFALDSDGAFQLLTEPLADWLGYDREELYADGLETVLPEERDDLEEAMADLADGRASSTVETSLVAADGTRYPVEIELSKTPEDGAFDGIIGVVRDLSALREAREQLEAQQDRFQYLFDNLPDAVSVARFEAGEPIVTSVNDAFEDIFGYDEETIVGSSLNEFVLPDEKQTEAHKIDQHATEGRPWQGEVTRKTADGLREFLFRGVPFMDVDGTRYGFGIYTDITERKQRARRLEVLTRVLRHNLRNDFSVLLGHAEVLERECGNEEPSLSSERLATSTEKLRAGIEQVAGLAEDARRIQTVLEQEPEQGPERPLETVVERTLTKHEDANPEATLEREIPSDLTVTVDDRLELALDHLLENACDHAGEKPRVRVSAVVHDDLLSLYVADDGPGIPDAEWEIVTGEREITQLEHGSGLGLWAARWVAESYGGRIERCESELGGACIELRMPLSVVG